MTDDIYTQIKGCRACDSTKLTKYLDLGKMPLVNRLLNFPTEEEPRFPLEVMYCENCSLSQLSGVVDPTVLFSHYVYRSSVSKTFAQHCAALAKIALDDLGMKSNDLVIDIASNDGCALKEFLPYGIRPLGVDPAKNLAEMATKEGIKTLPEFWTPAVADAILSEYGPAKIVTAMNVFAHVADISSFIKGVDRVLAEDGTFIIEVPYLVDLLKDNIFDTIYHEHLSYFLATPMVRVLSRQGLHVNRIDHLPIHGGTIRVYSQRQGNPEHSVDDMLRFEKDEGFLTLDRYHDFHQNAEAIKTDLAAMIHGLKAKNKKIAAFGASAKGSIMLNYCGLDQDDISYVVDDTPEKQGKFMAGCHIPIVPRSYLDVHKPDYLLVLAWNFFKEVQAKTTDFKKGGGRYILPIPTLHIV